MKNADETSGALWTNVLRKEDAALGASAGVEARLRSEVRAIGREQRRRRLATYAAAAVVVLAAAGLWLRPSVESPVTASTQEVRTGYYPLFYASVPTRSTHLVRLEVPRAALASFGLASLDVVLPRDSATVLADVVIGDDGLARAVRFVHSPISQE